MANSPTPPSPSSEFQPTFRRVVQDHDFDCGLFACIAMVAGKTLAQVRKVAVDKFGVPEHGPWWMTDTMLTGICNAFDWGATAYKQAHRVADLSDIAFLMVDYNPKTEVGRHVLFHRQRAAAGVEYIVDPAGWITEPTKQILMDVKGMPPPLWHVAVHPLHTGNKAKTK